MKWLGKLLVVAVAIALTGFGVSTAVSAFRNTDIAETHVETNHTQIVNAVTRTEEVALLSLGIQGIVEKNQTREVFGVKVPWSDRAIFLQYSFTAKLGIEGKGVTISQIDDSRYRISIPKFIFIGHDDIQFKMAAENNGSLSWVTPKIDSIELVNQILDPSAQAQYILEQSATLREQVQDFYGSLTRSIDPSIELDFVFASEEAPAAAL